jgi:antitoxin HicB
MRNSIYKLPLVLEPQPEGGYTITSPILPELVTEADAMDEVNANVADALAAIIEVYEDLGRPLPEILLDQQDIRDLTASDKSDACYSKPA